MTTGGSFFIVLSFLTKSGLHTLNNLYALVECITFLSKCQLIGINGTELSFCLSIWKPIYGYKCPIQNLLQCEDCDTDILLLPNPKYISNYIKCYGAYNNLFKVPSI